MNHPPEEPDELSAKLRAWQVDPAVSAGFQREVWQQIAVLQAARESAFWPALLERCTAFLTRPAFALSLAFLCISGSVAFGRAVAREANDHTWKNLESRYALSINPAAHQVDHLNHEAP